MLANEERETEWREINLLLAKINSSCLARFSEKFLLLSCCSRPRSKKSVAFEEENEFIATQESSRKLPDSGVRVWWWVMEWVEPFGGTKMWWIGSRSLPTFVPWCSTIIILFYGLDWNFQGETDMSTQRWPVSLVWLQGHPGRHSWRDVLGLWHDAGQEMTWLSRCFLLMPW